MGHNELEIFSIHFKRKECSVFIMKFCMNYRNYAIWLQIQLSTYFFKKKIILTMGSTDSFYNYTNVELY